MKRAKRILVGLKTLEHAADLTNLAWRMGARDASIHLVHVIELPDPTPLDAQVPDLELMARKILRKGSRVARRSGLEVSTHVLRAHSAGPALLDELVAKKIDLGVFGYHHRRTIGEILLGTAAQYIAKHAPCHALFLVPPKE